ncbi:hypothetical protein U1Q18_010495 [Sarracenia purpurea var. burkii]
MINSSDSGKRQNKEIRDHGESKMEGAAIIKDGNMEEVCAWKKTTRFCMMNKSGANIQEFQELIKERGLGNVRIIKVRTGRKPFSHQYSEPASKRVDQLSAYKAH